MSQCVSQSLSQCHYVTVPFLRFGGLYVGDAILVCNDQDLRTMSHQAAVQCLSTCGDELVLKVCDWVT